MKVATLIVFFMLFTLFTNNCVAYGPPSYIPDSPHPRIFLTADKLADLSKLVANNDPDWLALKTAADGYLNKTVPAYNQTARLDGTIYYNYQGAGWRVAMLTLGVAYKATGNTAYAAKMKEIIDVINTAGNTAMTVDSGYPSRNIALAMAIAYDWLYDYLDIQTKTAMINTINNWFDWYKTSAYKRTDATGTSNYFGGHVMGFGLCGLATYGENSRSGEMNSFIRNLWDYSVVPAFETGAFAGGYATESYDYGSDQFIYLFTYALGVKTATGEDLIRKYPESVATALLYNLKPNRWQSTVEGDMPGNFAGMMRKYLPLFLSGCLYSNTGNEMQYFLSDLSTPPYPSMISQRDPYPYEKVLYKTNKTPTNYKLSRPLFYRSAGDEHLFSRSDWSDGATWASFNGGVTHFASHQITGAGHIELQRGNENLLVTAGQWKGNDGITGSPSNYRLASVTANTLFFNDGGVYTVTTNPIFEGGQAFYGKSSVIAFEGNNSYQYMKADLTTAYNHNVYPVVPSTLSHFYRSFVTFGGGVTVVYDRIRAASPSYTKRVQWYLNPQAATVAAGSLVTSTLRGSRLHLQTIFPSDASTVVTTNPPSLFPTIASVATIYGKRVEVSGTSSTDFNPLTVMVAGSTSDPITSTTAIVTTGMLGVALSGNKVVLLSKDGSPQRNAAYTVSTPVVGTHLLVDMEPGRYDVYVDKKDFLTGIEASDQGVLSFQSNGGVTFQIVKSGDVPVRPPTGISGQWNRI